MNILEAILELFGEAVIELLFDPAYWRFWLSVGLGVSGAWSITIDMEADSLRFGIRAVMVLVSLVLGLWWQADAE